MAGRGDNQQHPALMQTSLPRAVQDAIHSTALNFTIHAPNNSGARKASPFRKSLSIHIDQPAPREQNKALKFQKCADEFLNLHFAHCWEVGTREPSTGRATPVWRALQRSVRLMD